MEDVPVGIMSPFFSDLLTLLSIILSIILLIALSYIWSTQRQDKDNIEKLSTIVKNLSKKIKDLEAENSDKSSLKETEENLSKTISINTLKEPSIKTPEVSEISESKKNLDDQAKVSKKPWATFLENYNHIAESMAVPGQLKACENFVAENKLKILVYTGNMNFIAASDVRESKFWAWKIEENNTFAVVPNPMIKYDEDLHSKSGMKETFASNYESGDYKKYFVELPAILNFDENNKWKILEPGVIRLER